MECKNTIPPKLATRLLTGLIRSELAEEVLGDLEEKFHVTLETQSPFRAKLNYWYQVLNYLRPFAMKRLRSNHPNPLMMYGHYFKISWRILLRQKMYTLIKIGGFAVGITACLLIALYINGELSYDKSHPDHEQIYRMYFDYELYGEYGSQAVFQAPFRDALIDHFPEIEFAGRINTGSWGSQEVRRTDHKRGYHEESVVFLDQEILDILRPRMIEGTIEGALTEPNSVVLFKSVADKYFPEGHALGQTILFNENKKQPYKITGVIEDLKNSHLRYTIWRTMQGVEFWEGEQQDWNSTNYYTYVKIHPKTDIAALEKKMDVIVEKYWGEMLDELAIDMQTAIDNSDWHLQPIADVHLMSTHIDDSLIRGDIRLVWLFGTIAILILVLASINFINLSTAKATTRSKEVGLRKALGSKRGNLVWQFLVESVLLSILSFSLAIMFVLFLLPHFNTLMDKSIEFPWLTWWFVPMILLVAVVVGILSGLYPALYLSAFRPMDIFRKKMSVSGGAGRLSGGLVVFQFTTSIILIVGTVIINSQMHYILNKDLGFEEEQVILLHGAHTLKEGVRPLKEELLNIPGVLKASISDYLPVTGRDVRRNGNNFWNTKSLDAGAKNVQIWVVDEDYIETMGMVLLSGRDFCDEPGDNRNKVIVNETLVEKLGLDQPLGTVITNDPEANRRFEIIGVVKDFHFQSLEEPIQSLCLRIGHSPSVVSLKLDTENVSALIRAVSEKWDEFSPQQPMRYSFLDDRFAAMHRNVERTGELFNAFALLAVLVACSGLFALTVFMTDLRNKEVSIRKVFGASLLNIFNLLTSRFIKLIFFSMLIAIPLSWYMMQRWLEDFAYRVNVEWWYFVLTGTIVVGIALVTISGQVVKVAKSNPVEFLRSE